MLFIGDLNTNSASPNDHTLKNIAGAIGHSHFHEKKIQGALFPDCGYSAFLNPKTGEYIIKRARNTPMKTMRGEPYADHELPPLDISKVPPTQAEEIKRQKPILKLGDDEYYNKEKLVGGLTIVEFEEFLKKRFPDDKKIIARVSKNVNNEPGIAMRFDDKLANDLKTLAPFLPDINFQFYNESSDDLKSNFVSVPQKDSYHLINISFLVQLSEINQLAADNKIKTNERLSLLKRNIKQFFNDLLAYRSDDRQFILKMADTIFSFPNINIKDFMPELNDLFAVFHKEKNTSSFIKMFAGDKHDTSQKKRIVYPKAPQCSRHRRKSWRVEAALLL